MDACPCLHEGRLSGCCVISLCSRRMVGALLFRSFRCKLLDSRSKYKDFNNRAASRTWARLHKDSGLPASRRLQHGGTHVRGYLPAEAPKPKHHRTHQRASLRPQTTCFHANHWTWDVVWRHRHSSPLCTTVLGMRRQTLCWYLCASSEASCV